MNTCSTQQNAMLEALYGEIDKHADDALQAHLSTCTRCSDEFQSLQKTLGLIQGAGSLQGTPQHDPWSKLQGGMRTTQFLRQVRWATPLLAIAAAIALAILLTHPKTSPPPGAAAVFRDAINPEAQNLSHLEPAKSNLTEPATNFKLAQAASDAITNATSIAESGEKVQEDRAISRVALSVPTLLESTPAMPLSPVGISEDTKNGVSENALGTMAEKTIYAKSMAGEGPPERVEPSDQQRIAQYWRRARPLLLALSNRELSEQPSPKMQAAESRVAAQLSRDAAQLRQDLATRLSPEIVRMLDDGINLFQQVADLDPQNYKDEASAVQDNVTHGNLLFRIALLQLRNHTHTNG